MPRSNGKVIRVFLNPHCNYHTGLSRWKKVEKEVRSRMGTLVTEEIRSPDGILSQVSEALDNGENMFIAAGGDGTVSLLLNAIMKLSDAPSLTIGAVGLGSSNDFHKPFRRKALINGVPVRIDFKDAIACDVIRIDYHDIQGNGNTSFCLVNASIGITAEANATFNSRSALMSMLQRLSADVAIAAAALKAIFTFPDLPCRLTLNGGEEQQFPVTNLGIIKNPHFAGTLCYDTSIEPDDGELGINLCMGLSLSERIRMLVALYNHRFHRYPKTKSWTATQLSVRSDQVFALEMDGEVTHTDSADFSIIPKRVRCCR